MCGIFALLCSHPDYRECLLRQVNLNTDQWIHRGPDAFGCVSTDRMLLASCVLHQRGPDIVRQPVDWEDGVRRRVLLWNGELFTCSSPGVDLIGSDTVAVGRLLDGCESLADLLGALSTLGGPHAFFYFAVDLGLVIFGRDLFGRRSLLAASPQGGHLAWSSIAVNVGTSTVWTEVPAFGVFSFDLSTRELSLHPYSLYAAHLDGSSVGEAACVTSLCGLPVRLDQRSVRRFTIDCGIVRTDCPAANVASCPADIGSSGLEAAAPEWVHSELGEFERLLSEAVACRVLLCAPPQLSSTTTASLLAAVVGQHSAVAVLFSGGVDSTLLTALAARHAPKHQSIDLLNVAFEQCPVRANPTAAKNSSRNRRAEEGRKSEERPDTRFSVPDRLTGIESLAELRQLCPDRVFNFVTINVTISELKEARLQRISRLCRPCNTVLDDSLGCAVWFAARGLGRLEFEHNPHLRLLGCSEDMDYLSPSKVVLCGMGADELLCGYSRHRYIYTQSGYPAVADEVTMEIKRIAQRNLGRDDRMVADHGREARFPYLDERLVNYLANLPPWKKADLSQDRGLGEKLLLRLCALRLGLPSAAVRPKRAMQFGSRIAKSESRRERGGAVCDRLGGAGDNSAV